MYKLKELDISGIECIEKNSILIKKIMIKMFKLEKLTANIDDID